MKLIARILTPILFLSAASAPLPQDDLGIEEVKAAIFKLNPNVEPDLATLIASSLKYCSYEKSIDWRILVSIAYVESNFDPTITRKVRGKSVDYGVMEINITNIKRFKLDKKKLKDPVYNISASCKIIEDIKLHKQNWVGYYNTGMKNKDKKLRYTYIIKVSEALEKIF